MTTNASAARSAIKIPLALWLVIVSCLLRGLYGMWQMLPLMQYVLTKGSPLSRFIF